MCTLQGHELSVEDAVLLGPEEARLVSGSRDSSVVLWDVRTEQKVGSAKLARNLVGFFFFIFFTSFPLGSVHLRSSSDVWRTGDMSGGCGRAFGAPGGRGLAGQAVGHALHVRGAVL